MSVLGTSILTLTSRKSTARHRAATRSIPTGSTVPAAVVAAARSYEDVDVAIVMESTYPFLKGGVSAVVHDIVTENPDLTYGIIHLGWDAQSPSLDLYGVPSNVRWVRTVYLSMQEHRHDFMTARVSDLRMSSAQRRQLSDRLFDAVEALAERGETEPLWTLLDEGMNERTRTFPLWALLGSREFMEALGRRLPQLGLSFADSFWVLRNFFSLAYAVLGERMPRARVYHAHTTGYAALLGAAAARDHGTAFLLTEHNLYVRDTVNTLLDRNMALSLTAEDYRTFDDVDPEKRAWMAWWIELGRFCYPSAQLITYLYPTAITEAAALGTDIDKSLVLPNGMVIEEFEEKYRARLDAVERILAEGDEHVWRLAYIARVVPIKGLMDLLDCLALLRHRGFTRVHLDVLGPTDHTPDYFDRCVARIEELGLVDAVTIHGTVNVRQRLDEIDLLVLSSYNEGQPIVVLEAMSAGIPTVGTDVGGMDQLIHDELRGPDGRTWDACGELVEPGDAVALAEAIAGVISRPERYARLARNARGRVEDFFQMADVMRSYNHLYRMLGDLPDEREPGRFVPEDLRRAATNDGGATLLGSPVPTVPPARSA